jgi:hypothetical protein
MSAAAKGLAALLAMSVAACGGEQQQQPATVNNASAATDVEALPADESASTPSAELANGAAEPQGNTADVEP